MPYDGNGQFILPASPIYPAVPGTTIEAQKFNTIMESLKQGLSSVLVRDGQAAMSGDLKMNNNRLLFLAPANATGHAVEYTQWQESFLAPDFGKPTGDTPTEAEELTNTRRLVNLEWAIAKLALKGDVAGQAWQGSQNFLSANTQVANQAVTVASQLAANTLFVKNYVASIFTGITEPVTVSAAELNFLAGLNSNAQNQIDSKGAKGGQVWTGVHNFTGATLHAATLPITVADTRVATTAFVAAAAFAAALPGQATHAGELLTTDGTNAGWSDTLTKPLNVPAGAFGTQVPQAADVPLLARRTFATAVTGPLDNGTVLSVWTDYGVSATGAFARPLPTTGLTLGDVIALSSYNNTLGNGQFTLTVPAGSVVQLPNLFAVTGPDVLIFDDNNHARYELHLIATAPNNIWLLGAT